MVVAACALNDSTWGMFGAAAFRAMKPTAVFVNVARGGVVDQDALVAALASGAIRGAALDVSTPDALPPSHPLLRLANCVKTPHMAPSPAEAWSGAVRVAVANAAAVLSGGDMPAEVFS